MTEVVGTTLVVVGVLFDLFGCIGLLRMPDVYNRMQAATKCVTGGTCLILIGTVIVLGSAAAVISGLVCIAFVLVTSPTAAHALARAAHRSGIPLWEGSIVDRYTEDRAAETDSAT